MDIHQFEGRKRDHLRHALNPDHQASGLGGLDRVHLHHDALPELDFNDVSLDSPFLNLGIKVPTPFYVAGMTAGHENAAELNRVFARACSEMGWILGVGSQRRELEAADLAQVDGWKKLREEAPEIRLIANIGISQAISAPIPKLRNLVESLEAQALAVHANALQEALQPEGTPRFRGATKALARLVEELDCPVILKETGCGFSARTLERLSGIGLAAIDVSGLGGTHWGRIEGARAGDLPGLESEIRTRTARTFQGWGESTVDSVIAAKAALGAGTKTEIWASGGVRSGLDAARLIALGAHRVGYAQPALQAALEGVEPLVRWMRLQEYELKVALFCTGSATPSALREKGPESYSRRS